MFPSGYFSIPYSVTGGGISDPATTPLVGDQSQIVGSDRTRLKRLRPGTNVTLSSTDDAITISSLGGGGDGTSSVLTLNNPATTPLDGDVSLRYDGQSVKRLRPGSSRITCVDQSDCVVLDTPVLAYTKSESDAKYRTILGSYDNTQVYNRTESDSKYRTVADSYPKTDVYTKTECTDVFLQKVNEKAVVATGTSDDGESVVQDDHILKRLKGTGTVTVTSEANRLVINGTASSTVDAYTKTESDSKYRTIADSYDKTECDNKFQPLYNLTPGRSVPLPLLNFDFSYRDACGRALWQGFGTGTGNVYSSYTSYVLCTAYPLKSSNTYWNLPTAQQLGISATSNQSGIKPYIQVSQPMYYLCNTNNRPRLGDWVVLVLTFQDLVGSSGSRTDVTVLEKRGGTGQRRLQLVVIPKTSTAYWQVRSVLMSDPDTSYYSSELSSGPQTSATADSEKSFVLCFQYTTTQIRIKFGKRDIINVLYTDLSGTGKDTNQSNQTDDLTGDFYFGQPTNANNMYYRFFACRFYDKELGLTDGNINTIANETHEEFGCTSLAS